MAAALYDNGEVAEACSCYQKLDKISANLLESDETFVDKYWHSILSGLADCHVDLERPEIAADIYKRVKDHYVKLLEETMAEEPDDGQYDYVDEFDDEKRYYCMLASAYVTPIGQMVLLLSNEDEPFVPFSCGLRRSPST